MLASRRVVTLCDFPFDKAPVTETERLLTMINDMPSTTVFVMWYETVEINEKKPGEKFNKLFKAVNSAGGAVCYLGRRSDTEIFKILQSGAARRKRMVLLIIIRIRHRTRQTRIARITTIPTRMPTRIRRMTRRMRIRQSMWRIPLIF